MRIRKKTLLIIIGLIILGLTAGGAYAVYKNQKYQKAEVPEAVDSDSLQSPITTSNDTKTPTVEINASPELSQLPSQLNLKMEFYSQAPFSDWSMPWQEACEEASIILVVNQYGHHNWTRTEFNQQILDLVEWEKQRFGQYEHTNVEEMIAMLKEKFNLSVIEHQNPTLNDIKQILSKGHFIIAPFAGKKLGNPNYKNGGPTYHVLVIKGYLENKIITNDVGTRLGADYVYTWEKINESLHDYATPIENGAKTIIEVLPSKL